MVGRLQLECELIFMGLRNIFTKKNSLRDFLNLHLVNYFLWMLNNSYMNHHLVVGYFD